MGRKTRNMSCRRRSTIIVVGTGAFMANVAAEEKSGAIDRESAIPSLTDAQTVRPMDLFVSHRNERRRLPTERRRLAKDSCPQPFRCINNIIDGVANCILHILCGANWGERYF